MATATKPCLWSRGFAAVTTTAPELQAAYQRLQLGDLTFIQVDWWVISCPAREFFFALMIRDGIRVAYFGRGRSTRNPANNASIIQQTASFDTRRSRAANLDNVGRLNHWRTRWIWQRSRRHYDYFISTMGNLLKSPIDGGFRSLLPQYAASWNDGSSRAVSVKYRKRGLPLSHLVTEYAAVRPTS